jgi:hypothetical protein
LQQKRNRRQIHSGTEIEYLKLWFTTDGTRTLSKEISVAALGSVDAINADPWPLERLWLFKYRYMRMYSTD